MDFHYLGAEAQQQVVDAQDAQGINVTQSIKSAVLEKKRFNSELIDRFRRVNYVHSALEALNDSENPREQKEQNNSGLTSWLRTLTEIPFYIDTRLTQMLQELQERKEHECNLNWYLEHITSLQFDLETFLDEVEEKLQQRLEWQFRNQARNNEENVLVERTQEISSDDTVSDLSSDESSFEGEIGRKGPVQTQLVPKKCDGVTLSTKSAATIDGSRKFNEKYQQNSSDELSDQSHAELSSKDNIHTERPLQKEEDHPCVVILQRLKTESVATESLSFGPNLHTGSLQQQNQRNESETEVKLAVNDVPQRNSTNSVGRNLRSNAQQVHLKVFSRVRLTRSNWPTTKNLVVRRKRSTARPFKCSLADRPFWCSSCGACFRQKYHLTRHYLVHTGEKPFKCTICARDFSRKDYLARHIPIHSDERKYACDICNGSFKQKHKLSRHMGIHIGKRNVAKIQCV